MGSLVEPYGVYCVNAELVRKRYPVKRLNGWELKCYALLHSRFQEVMLLDADNVPVRDPSFLFATPAYEATGALFWPDFGRFSQEKAIWDASGLEYRDEPEFESGQIVLDKARTWRTLSVAMHLNENSQWWYRLMLGDKDTFHIAWRKLKQDYSMCPFPVRSLPGVMLQYDWEGACLFQHRNFAKWQLHGSNRRIAGFTHETDCLQFLAELRTRWTELPPGVRRFQFEHKTAVEREAATSLCARQWIYRRIGHEERPMLFDMDGHISIGSAGWERYWGIRLYGGKKVFGRFRGGGGT